MPVSVLEASQSAFVTVIKAAFLIVTRMVSSGSLTEQVAGEGDFRRSGVACKIDIQDRYGQQIKEIFVLVLAWGTPRAARGRTPIPPLGPPGVLEYQLMLLSYAKF
jgi:hypothetical protein